MHNIYNYLGAIDSRSVDYSNRDKGRIFSDVYYLSYFVFFNIEKDLSRYNF